MERTATTARPPAALTVALVIVAVETVAEVTFVLTRDDYGPGGKALVGGLLACKILLAVSARRLQAGGALGLLLFELVGILVAIAVVCIAIAVQFGGKIKALFETADGEIDTVDSNL